MQINQTSVEELGCSKVQLFQTDKLILIVFISCRVHYCWLFVKIVVKRPLAQIQQLRNSGLIAGNQGNRKKLAQQLLYCPRPKINGTNRLCIIPVTSLEPSNVGMYNVKKKGIPKRTFRLVVGSVWKKNIDSHSHLFISKLEKISLI